MAELALVFMGGLLGSSHCAGMCGAFAISIGSATTGMLANARRQVVYSLGRIFTYAAFGAAAGYLGLRLMHRGGTLVNVQAILAVVAGGLLLVQGVVAAGWLRWPGKSVASPCLAGGLLRSFLTAPGLANAFLAGMLTGFLPCGLVYAYLALAATTGSLLGGLLRMCAFGLGTAPLLVLVGCGGSLLGMAVRQRLLRLAAWCVVLVGLISIARGVGALPQQDRHQPAECVFCRQAVSQELVSPERSRPAATRRH
jgi:uncharacterized protein